MNLIKSYIVYNVSRTVTNPVTLENIDEALQTATTGTPADADTFSFHSFIDGVLKLVSWVNIKATLKTYFDGLYVSLNNYHFKGLFISEAALVSAYPTANPGDYADVDPGVGTDAVRYIWDEDEGWVAGGSGAGVQSVVAGANISVDNTDPTVPIVAVSADEDLDDERDLDVKIPIASSLTTSPRQIMGLPVSRTITDSDSLDAGDAFSVLDVNISTDKNITVPPNIFSAGDICYVLRRGSGIVTFVEGSGVTITPQLGALIDSGENSIVTLVFTSTTQCLLQNGIPVSISSADIINALGYTPANAVNSWTRVYMTSDQTVNNANTTYINITELLFPVVSGVKMEWRAVIAATPSNTNEGFMISVDGPTETELFMRNSVSSSATAEAVRYTNSYNGGAIPTASAAACLCTSSGFVKTSASGNINLKIATEGSSIDILLKKGSYVEYRTAPES